MNLIKATLSEFDLIYSEMLNNFIPEELRDFESALGVMGEENYSIYHITDRDTRVGFIAIWNLSEFVFVEHFVIYEEYRSCGFGARAISILKDKFKKIVLEVEPPCDDAQKRRLAFYERCGFCKNGIEYVQPPYRRGEKGVKLILLSYPEALENPSAAKEQLYSIVYKIKN